MAMNYTIDVFNLMVMEIGFLILMMNIHALSMAMVYTFAIQDMNATIPMS